MKKQVFITVILVAAVVGTVTGVAASLYTPYLVEQGLFAPWISAESATPIATTGQMPVASDEGRVTELVQKALPSVVSIVITKNISAKSIQVNGMGDTSNDPFFGFPIPEQASDATGTSERVQIGGGTGFFVTANGIIATNKHVINDTEAEYTVVTQDGQELKAKVMAKDPVFDLAFLKVEGEGFSPLQLGDSDQVEIGETVIAIGNALAEFSNSVTKGIVSGKNRRLLAGSLDQSEVIEEAIQTDAAINFGNSGGPLLDLNGRVLGMNTAISDQAQLLGFALPINVVKRALSSVQEHGRIIRPWLGVRFVPIDTAYAKLNNLAFDYGAQIVIGDSSSSAVIPGSPADKSGLLAGDIILSLNDQRVDKTHSLANIISKKFPGDTVSLHIARAGEEKTVTVVLEERDPNF